MPAARNYAAYLTLAIMGWLLGLLAGGLVVFQTQVTPDKVAEKAVAALRERYPGATVAVRMTGRNGRPVLRGQFKTVNLVMSNFTAGDTLFPLAAVASVDEAGHVDQISADLQSFVWQDMPVARCQLQFEDVTFDWGRLKSEHDIVLQQTGAGQLRLTLDQTALAKVLEPRLAGIRAPRLRCRNGYLLLTGKYPLPVVGTLVPFSLRVTPQARSGGQIRLEDPHLRVVGLGVPGVLTNYLMGRLNPVFSLPDNGWCFRTFVQTIDTTPEGETVQARLVFRSPA